MSFRIILSSNYSPWSPYSGGGQRSTHHLAESLSELGYDVHVIFTKARFERISPPANLPYKLHWAEFSGFKSNRKNWFRGRSGLLVADIVAHLLQPGAVYHSNGEESSHIGNLRAKKTFPFVLTPRYPHIPKEASLKAPSTTNGWVKPFVSKYSLLGRSLMECDIFCPTSIFAAQLYRERYPVAEKPFEVVPNGIPNEFIDMKVSFDPPSQHRLVFFGRLSKEKGVKTLLKAANRIPDRIDELLFIGRGELESEIDNANKSGPLSGKINRSDWLSIPELIKEVSSSNIAILPSYEESFGNAIVEAMACGIPVITTNAGSIPEIITQNQNGIMIEPGDDQMLAKTIEQLFDDISRRTVLGKKGRETVVNNYSWDATAKKYLSIYSDLLEGHIA